MCAAHIADFCVLQLVFLCRSHAREEGQLDSVFEVLPVLWISQYGMVAEFAAFLAIEPFVAHFCQRASLVV